MKIDLHLRLPRAHYHFYRRRVGLRWVFSIYRNGTSIWRRVS